jgi:hypothetical protein
MSMMNLARSMVVRGALLAAVALFAAGPVEAAEPTTTGNVQPTTTGTVEMSGGSVAAGLGYSWGGGTLNYQGRQYRFKADGLRVGDVGITDIKAAGTVSHLDQVQDFNGNYAAVQAGVTVAGGGSVMAMQNQNGVVITLTSTTQGLDVNLGASGVNISLN